MQADQSLPTLATLLPHGVPPTGILIGGRRLPGETAFPVHDRYSQVQVAAVAAATGAEFEHASRQRRAPRRSTYTPCRADGQDVRAASPWLA